MDKQSTESTSVEIKTEYYRAIERIVKQSEEFESVSDYVNFVLHEMLDDQDTGYSEEEEEVLKNRLRDLGYL